MKKVYRPDFPKRAVITAGMPYGNKSLHFGHIGGVFIHADSFARFLRDRIGKENVIFVSGTDCYGSPIVASYKNYVEETKTDAVSMEEYVKSFHKLQKAILKQYQVEPNLYASSAFDESGEVHKEVSARVFNALYEKKHLIKESSLQFYDEEHQAYLNGRQVVGKCPVDGCKSEKAYADECSLGHQYLPMELLEPVSQLSGEKPILKEVENWYFDLDKYGQQIAKIVELLKKERATRQLVIKNIEEFLLKPAIYITRKEFSKLKMAEIDFAEAELIDIEKNPSVSYEFKNLAAREKALEILVKHNIRYRTGKTLVPFRISGNTEWGIDVPTKDGLDDLTFWVWPESLWAPVSFTETYLKMTGHEKSDWKDWWVDKDAKVYQFVGEDNIYFYGVAQLGLTLAYLGYEPDDERDLSDINVPRLVANFHLQFMNNKASSSGSVKPPMADELLEHYTAEQLRMYFLSLGLSKKGVSFNPKPFDKNADESVPDPVLKDGNLLTNVFNRTLRSAFYTAQKYTDGKIPNLEVSHSILDLVEKDTYDYERHMAKQDLHRVIYTLDHIIRHLSKHWAKMSKDLDENMEQTEQLLADSFYAIKSILLLLHPIAPESAENARQRMNVTEDLWSWEHIFKPTEFFMANPSEHKLEEIPPKYDFFTKHDSQL